MKNVIQIFATLLLLISPISAFAQEEQPTDTTETQELSAPVVQDSTDTDENTQVAEEQNTDQENQTPTQEKEYSLSTLILAFLIPAFFLIIFYLILKTFKF
ncbi:MAG TPA: hypothetical protein PLD77_00570 [Candidatus Dojkabacteria bacterium]|mgnify:CR=1 FL=1|nr:hypothetical protein [Candidatus Dojkabacteria bacterium]HOV34475.1 hypothetical protein [Candidatus Dojkabacteria bacterium]